MRAGVVIKNVTLPMLNLMLKQSKELFHLVKERECPVHMLKSIFEAGGGEKEQDDFEVQLYSRSDFPDGETLFKMQKLMFHLNQICIKLLGALACSQTIVLDNVIIKIKPPAHDLI